MPKTFKIDCPGYQIVADWYDGAPDKVLLVLPGFTSTRARNAELVEALVAGTGNSALVIDYSGHGESPFDLRDTCPAQHFLEVIKTFDWIKEHYPRSEIHVIGTSYGGLMATQLTKYRKFEKLILRAPAIYPPEDFYTLWRGRLDDDKAYETYIMKFRKNAKLLREHPLLARAAKFQGKTLLIAHELDEVVPKVVTDAYTKAFKADHIEAKNISHSLHDATTAQVKAYQTRLIDWLNNG